MKSQSQKKLYAWMTGWIVLSGLILLPACQKARMHPAGPADGGVGLHGGERNYERGRPNTDGISPIPRGETPSSHGRNLGRRPPQLPVKTDPQPQSDDRDTVVIDRDTVGIDRGQDIDYIDTIGTDPNDYAGDNPVPVGQTSPQPVNTTAPREVEWMYNKPSKTDVLAGCHGGPDGGDCIPDTPVQQPPKPPVTQEPLPTPGQCDIAPFVQPEGSFTSKLDLLFVVDTSQSLDEEREDIAKEIRQFVNNLSPNVDYNIAVLPAHGPVGNPETFGYLLRDYQYDPVIRSSEYSSLDEVRDELVRKMAQLTQVRDKSYFQGEAGLLSLYKFISIDSPYSDSANQATQQIESRFPREDAALSIVFIADENDVCYDYRPGEEGTYDTESDRIKEMQALEDCRTAGPNGSPITPQLVYDALAHRKGDMPVTISGIMYKNPRTIPQHTDDPYWRDNEIGRGYLDLIHLANGEVIDLADRNFSRNMSRIGQISNFDINFYNVFPLDVPYLDVIDQDSVQVTVYRADEVSYDRNGNLIYHGPGIPIPRDYAFADGRVGVKRDELERIYTRDDFNPAGSIVRITCELLE